MFNLLKARSFSLTARWVMTLNGIDAMVAAASWPRQLLIKSDQDSSDRVIVVVQDSGIGIDPKDLDRLFDAFFTTKPDGLGMGLRICRTIIEDHSGMLWASRTPILERHFNSVCPYKPRSRPPIESRQCA